MSENYTEQLSAQDVVQASASLLEHFQVEANPASDPEAFRAALKQLNPRYKNERTLVRWELEQDETQWDTASLKLIEETSDNLGLLKHETPLTGEFSAVIILGGARMAPLDRSMYAIDSLHRKNDPAYAKQLFAAGSERLLVETEQKIVESYAPGAITEFDLSVGAVATVARRMTSDAITPVLIPGERANTEDAIRTVIDLMKRQGTFDKACRIGAVTTQIYQTATALDVARVANRFGIHETQVAGNPSDPNIVAKRTAATYLSEILRTNTAASHSL